MGALRLCLWILFFPIFLSASSIYEEIELLPFDGVGYFAAEPMLDRILKEQEINTVIEIGSWAGASTRFLAHRVGPEGKVYAIDHWQGTPENPGEMSDSRLSYIYQLFLSNIHHFQLTDRVVPVRMSSKEAIKALSHVHADLIFIDGPRSTQEVFDTIVSWHNQLVEGGVICGTEWREQTIRNGVQKAAQHLQLQIEVDKKGLAWVLRP